MHFPRNPSNIRSKKHPVHPINPSRFVRWSAPWGMFNGRSNPKNGACTHTHTHTYRGVRRYRSSVVINQAAFLPPRNRRHPIGIPSERPFTLHRKQPRLESFSIVPAPFHFHIFVSRSNDRFPRFLSREDLVVRRDRISNRIHASCIHNIEENCKRLINTHLNRSWKFEIYYYLNHMVSNLKQK